MEKVFLVVKEFNVLFWQDTKKVKQKELSANMMNSEQMVHVSNKKLTRGTKKLIKKAIKETRSKNKYELCDYIANDAMEKYQGDHLEYQLERMNIQSTSAILQAIDIFFYKHLKHTS